MQPEEFAEYKRRMVAAELQGYLPETLLSRVGDLTRSQENELLEALDADDWQEVMRETRRLREIRKSRPAKRGASRRQPGKGDKRA